MTNPLDPMRQLLGTGALGGPAPTTPTPAAKSQGGAAPVNEDGKSFSDVMKDFVDQADTTQKEFDQAIEAVERGDTDNLHQVMIAQSQAQLSLRLAAEVRNKLVEAYREVMRTQF